jgi:hypothetical protein
VSKTLNQHTLTGAIVGADAFLGPDRVWTAKNEFQRAFIGRHFAGPKHDLPALEKLNLMETKASYDSAVLNEVLKRRGFSIQLDPFAPGDFGVVSILEMLVGWIVKGQRMKLDCSDGQSRDAVHLAANANVAFYECATAAGMQHVAAVPAVFGLGHQDNTDPNAPPPQPDVFVYMTRLDDVPDGFELLDLVGELSANKRPNYDFEGVMFPMVDLDHKADISALCGLATQGQDGRNWEVGQALQQNILKMNEKGVLAKSATAIMMRCTSFRPPKPPLVIDGPFLVWFELPGMAEPLFTAFVTEDAFKDPGDLE